jgi:hypothetical protein
VVSENNHEFLQSKAKILFFSSVLKTTCITDNPSGNSWLEQRTWLSNEVLREKGRLVKENRKSGKTEPNISSCFHFPSTHLSAWHRLFLTKCCWKFESKLTPRLSIETILSYTDTGFHPQKFVRWLYVIYNA